jgi:hypothetical protein
LGEHVASVLRASKYKKLESSVKQVRSRIWSRKRQGRHNKDVGRREPRSMREVLRTRWRVRNIGSAGSRDSRVKLRANVCPERAELVP